MGRTLGKVRNLTIQANTSPCAHICRYCQIGDRGPMFPLDRWTAFVERFADWSKSEGPDGLRVQGGFIGPAYNFDLDTFIALSRWRERTEGNALNWIFLGGLKMRSEPDMRQWLLERQAVGVEGVHASFVGLGAVHDRWHGRCGDFDFLMSTLGTAVELGLTLSTTLYLTKSGLPHMEDLEQILNNVPVPRVGRHARPFYNIGHGAHHDAERISEEDRENLPAFLREYLPSEWILRSEREWIETIRREEETLEDLSLHLELTGQNIDRLEAMSCNDILADLETRARATLSACPSLSELCETYADPNGMKIYVATFDLERLWLSRFLEAHPMDFDRSLVHYHFGRSLNPPPLWELKP